MKKGYFGEFGGQFVPELLMPPLRELENAMETIMPEASFREELESPALVCNKTAIKPRPR